MYLRGKDYRLEVPDWLRDRHQREGTWADFVRKTRRAARYALKQGRAAAVAAHARRKRQAD